ncbi:hypothetical protein CBR_g4137 [Chara braunii]|uniref:Uncharacterized protein n=1 Tax=Chara braunii TaxID=69332 RepID=A0A388KHC4_CHABU|nr:hypothetical protein CBR_g4137 [Chara braunii]|eukprot:GBG69442.1 hypothetical protein CBR_g4137 [Chara braunii]
MAVSIFGASPYWYTGDAAKTAYGATNYGGIGSVPARTTSGVEGGQLGEVFGADGHVLDADANGNKRDNLPAIQEGFLIPEGLWGAQFHHRTSKERLEACFNFRRMDGPVYKEIDDMSKSNKTMYHDNVADTSALGRVHLPSRVSAAGGSDTGEEGGGANNNGCGSMRDSGFERREHGGERELEMEEHAAADVQGRRRCCGETRHHTHGRDRRGCQQVPLLHLREAVRHSRKGDYCRAAALRDIGGGEQAHVLSSAGDHESYFKTGWCLQRASGSCR